uniref:CHK kinase-like domain-containing protein n=1 Tax=Graphocephala atropunctata TaxID=36148 RepID=A0A1B6MJK0_9HEMI
MDPTWLDSLLVTQILQSEEGIEDLEVIQYKCQPAVPVGTNYLSHLYRISIHYKTGPVGSIKSTSLIVKTPLLSGEMKRFLERGNGYQREFNIYNKVLPKLYELHSARLTAKSFPCPLHESLVLEDLHLRGYKMADRLVQLDFRHCQLFLKSLAKFHALSYAAHKTRPQLIEGVGKNLFYNEDLQGSDQKLMRDMTVGLLRSMSNTVRTLDVSTHYAEKIEKLADSSWERMVRILKPDGALSVLNHGDTWTNNILFKYNEAGEVMDVRLVDFQYAQYCSFSLDIIYFWWTSANEEVREHHQEKLFEDYCETLNNTFLELNCDRTLSREIFSQEMKAGAPYSLYVMSTVLGVAMADPDNLLQFNEISQDDFTKDFNKKNLTSKYYKAVLPKMLEQVEKFGAFE